MDLISHTVRELVFAGAGAFVALFRTIAGIAVTAHWILSGSFAACASSGTLANVALGCCHRHAGWDRCHDSDYRFLDRLSPSHVAHPFPLSLVNW
jgi:hypothetical protein